MKTVLVTGGIGSGKSEVCRYLAARGFPVYDSDSRTKALYGSVPGLKEKVEAAIGAPLSEAAVIFRDPARRERLEAVVYPEVLADFKAWRASRADAVTVFMESAVALGKSIFEGLWDEVWLVEAPLEQRKARNPKVAGRLASQPPADRSKVDIIIENDSTLEALHKKIDSIINMKTDLSKILSVSGKHGLYRFLALSRNNAAIAEALADGHRTVFDPHSRITTLADIAIYTESEELKLKEVFLSINKVLEGREAPGPKSSEAEIKALFEKAVPNYDPDRFYVSHMRKILDWYGELVKYASLDFVEEEEEEKAAEEENA